LLARDDHVVSKCAHFVERNRGVVLYVPGAVDRRKEREGTGWRGLNDEIAQCDEDVARGERVRHSKRGLRWRYINVFFPARGRLVHQGNPVAAERIDVCFGGDESGSKKFSL